jgi:hypothetical protein
LRDPATRVVDLDNASRLRLDDDSALVTRIRRLHVAAMLCVRDIFVPPRLGTLVAYAADRWHRGATTATTIIALLNAGPAEPISEAEQRVTALARCCGSTGCISATGLRSSSPAHLRPDRFPYRLLLKRGSA